MAVRICPVCGGKVASTRSTCSHCGYEMKATKKCPECEEYVDINVNECPACGYEFDSVPMSEVPEEKSGSHSEPVIANPATHGSATSDTMVAKFFKNATKEEFLRSVFYHITKNSDTPLDILSAKFGEVEEGEAQGFAVYGTANGHYTASIGYDRQEVYYESERKYDSTIKDYRYVNVEKTRTVTDWRPFNGNITNEGCSAVVVEPKYILLEKCFYELLKRKDLEEIHEEHPDIQEVPGEVYSKGKTALSQNVRNGIRFPGDHVKDVSCGVSISDYKVFRCIVPTYKVVYEYEGRKYFAEGFAIDGCTPFFTVPETSSSALSETKLRDQEKAAVKIAEKPNKIASFLGGLAAFLAVCSFVLGLTLGEIIFVIWTVGFSAVGCSAATAITLAIITSVKVKKLHAEYDAKVEKLKIIKGLLLNKKLTEYGFEKITETEKIYLDLMDVDLDVEDFDIDALLSAPAATDGSTVSNPRVKKKGALIAMWLSLAFTALGYVINMIIALCVGGYLRWMFDYILAGYIAGFIVMGIGIIVFIISLFLHLKSKEKKSKIACIISVILMVCILCITFAPLVFYDPLSYEQKSDGTYSVVDCHNSATEVKIPSTHKGKPITSIDFHAFDGCYNLTSITIPDSITSIDSDAFNGCHSLTNVYIEDLAAWCNISFDRRLNYSNPLSYAENLYLNNELITEQLIIPDNVTTIRFGAFYNYDNLTSVIIPDSVTSIGDSAFAGCNGLTIYCEFASKPSDWSTDFYWNTDWNAIDYTETNKPLESYHPVYWAGQWTYDAQGIPTPLCELNGHDWADATCTAPKTCTVCNQTIGSNLSHDLNGGNCRDCDYTILQYTLSEDRKSYIVNRVDNAPTRYEGDLIILSEYKGLPVTHIGESAFYNCSSLTSITIPDSVTSIGSSAFRDCTSLTSITISDSVTSIGDYAFDDCTSLTSITIPDSVTSIGSYAFTNCPIEKATIPSLAISKVNNSKLKEVIITSGESIASYAFVNCTSLTSITIPDSVTSIGSSAFSGCSNLTSITIPDSVTSIRKYAFEDCTSLTNVYYLGTAEEWEEISIHSYNTLLTSATRYYYSENQPTTPGNYWHYDQKGNVVVW